VASERISPREDARFGPLRATIEENWNENSPEMVRLLEQRGEFQQRLDEAAENAIVTMNQALECGLAPDQARELAYESLLFYERT
jgi:hypothetical protein